MLTSTIRKGEEIKAMVALLVFFFIISTLEMTVTLSKIRLVILLRIKCYNNFFVDVVISGDPNLLICVLVMFLNCVFQ